MASKNMILKRKIGNDIFELFPKTTDGQVNVTYGEAMTLAAALSSIYTDVTAWNTFKAGVDFAGTDAALDTLRELIDMINDADAAGSIANKLAAIDTQIAALEAKDTALETKIDDNTTSIGNNATAIAKNATDITTNAEAIDALDTRVTTAEGDIDAVEARVTVNEGAIATINTTIGNLADQSSHIYSGATAPETLTENDLFIEILA